MALRSANFTSALDSTGSMNRSMFGGQVINSGLCSSISEERKRGREVERKNKKELRGIKSKNVKENERGQKKKCDFDRMLYRARISDDLIFFFFNFVISIQMGQCMLSENMNLK